MMEKVTYLIEDIATVSAGGDRPDIVSEVKTEKTMVPIYSNGMDNDGLYGYTDKARVEGDSVTISARGVNVGMVCYREEPFLPIVRLLSLVPNRNIVDAKYLYYVLKNISFSGTGSAQPQITAPMIRKQEIVIHKNPITQKRIAKILSLFDRKIQVNETVNDNLLQQSLCIYSEMIGSRSKDGCIGDYCSIKSGFAFKSKWWQDSGVPVIKIGSINQDCLNLSDCSYVSEDKISLANDFIVGGGDLLIAMTGATIGKFTMVPKVSETILVNQRVGKFFLGDNPISRLPFIYCTLKQPEIVSEVINRGQGSAQPNISASDIMSIPCVIPSTEVIDEFNKSTSQMFELIINNQYENAVLGNTRDSILPKLMSGELDVSELNL
ncbi:restriction endonuclease subunit S [Pseudobutyrivibrio xylanivorans]|uniref:Type I restriction modification DNA specificity domain-containing protein n=1 Tax=Pseudobutyrivibrio xylanivorans TaxID=185007 RepID=A0A5P6VUM7_PSEXY|nr:restriction endonuclease subunit S [Pseudobutyrivibrio xylanivorans]QFJ56022.1 hypothetical protein FXF36_14550 [Pseudobutyrivibrio xylanivorans]